jgi:hypothetical protein
MKKLDRTLFAGCAVAAALTIGCGQNENDANNRPDAANRPAQTPGTAGTAGTAADSRKEDKNPMTVTGCLQETKGMTGSYVLTQANAGSSSSAPVGTSGSTGSSSEAEQKQMTAARKSYRLSGETDQLKNLVGHQIRVTGVLSDRGDLAQSNPTADKNPSTNERAKARDIDDSDLPTIDVTTVSNVADSCGTKGKAPTSANPKSNR